MTTRSIALRIWNWRRAIRAGQVLVSVVLLAALAVGGFLAMRLLRPPQPTQILPGQALAWDIARSAQRSEGVQFASGAYIPGSALLLYTRTSQTDRARIRTWALIQLEPFAERLAKMSSGETLTWVIDFGPAPGEQEALSAPLAKATDPTSYRYVSAAPNLIAEGDAAAVSASAAIPTAAAATPVASSATTVAATDAPAGPAAAAAPAAGAAAAPLQATSLLTTAFDGADSGKAGWAPLSGDWAAGDGVYSQRDANGYDYISMLSLQPQVHYSFEARFRIVEGKMGGGFIYNAPNPTSRAGAQSVDFADGGGTLRWGRYDEKGAYAYAGGVTIQPSVNDGTWHTLSLVTHAGASVVSVDAHEVGTISNTSISGYLGLTASQAKVDFDDVTVVGLPEGSDSPSAAPATPASDKPFSDDFADGDAKGWQVLNGTWQIIEGAYQQTSDSGSDQSSVSFFRSDSFSATVQLRRIDGAMGGGLYFNIDRRDSKARSQLVNYTQGGKVLQWGHFDEGGNFVFEGSAPVPDGGDETWHTLGVRVKGGKATFVLDGQEVAADVLLTYDSGYVGLIANNSKVAFDDVQIVAQ